MTASQTSGLPANADRHKCQQATGRSCVIQGQRLVHWLTPRTLAGLRVRSFLIQTTGSLYRLQDHFTQLYLGIYSYLQQACGKWRRLHSLSVVHIELPHTQKNYIKRKLFRLYEVKQRTDRKCHNLDYLHHLASSNCTLGVLSVMAPTWAKH